ncbi:pyridoxal-phosphate-dependent aminotransferase family protein [Phormidium sp. CCY1219]|uniref:pyridoxal-phosphate-dependent aminotransferase family protein n=1 Tax=Phormidium sp. CCY1219 TaxID=2886104 RepID=UPI002D1F8D3E|nr:alanine--glyoxylate aminotransferase family protein [Phormidium sp. CCY1219]MEB3826476.1 alanine--glyoxylate aminotransferase family protein [Phormidium sp. CCY1219]
MDDKLMLMIPGPTPVPEQALLALAKHPIGHRSKEFEGTIAEVTENLKWLHQTQHDVVMLAGSGTAAMEAAIINFLSAGDRVVVGCNGKFGDRWAEVAEAYNLNVERITAEWGQPLDPEQFREKLEADTNKDIKAAIVTHSETSTGVLNDLETINRHVKAHGKALILVDAVTSLGALSVPMDEWGIDAIASGSQKGYMVPPGLGFVAVGPKAWEAYKTATLPKYYLDLAKYKKATDKSSSPFTPPINLIFALQATLQMMRREGLDAIFARHARQMEATRAAVRALGLKLFAPDDAAALSITAVESSDAEQIRAIVKKQFDISLAGGQNQLKGKVFRIGHLGFVSDRDILTAISAIEVALREIGAENFAPGAGVAAAAKVFAES